VLGGAELNLWNNFACMVPSSTKVLMKLEVGTSFIGMFVKTARTLDFWIYATLSSYDFVIDSGLFYAQNSKSRILKGA
jgi:hypothetical protein